MTVTAGLLGDDYGSAGAGEHGCFTAGPWLASGLPARGNNSY